MEGKEEKSPFSTKYYPVKFYLKVLFHMGKWVRMVKIYLLYNKRALATCREIFFLSL